jgi:hypothetical protein
VSLGKSIINNIDITGEFTYNEKPISSFIKEQISATSPLIYNNTLRVLSIDPDAFIISTSANYNLQIYPNDLRLNEANQ